MGVAIIHTTILHIAIFLVRYFLGFIGHFLDQKRLKQGLYRHPWDDISYLAE